ncbi:MAG: hypothetical protein ACRECH_13855, partial [Nitrososphaerales archaeon]
ISSAMPSVSSQSQTSDSAVSSISTVQPAANSQSNSTSSSFSSVSSSPQSGRVGALQQSFSKETAPMYGFASYAIVLVGGLPLVVRAIRKSGLNEDIYRWRW